LTILFVTVVFRRKLVGLAARPAREDLSVRFGPGGAGVVTTTMCMLSRPPAVPVLGLGIAVALATGFRPAEMAQLASPKLTAALLVTGA
jgi:hypothetical protein